MSPLLALAAGLCRAWVRLYTAGLRAELRDARRAEVDSDLWEQTTHDAASAAPQAGTAAHLLLRWSLGLPADLAWRLESQARGRDPAEEGEMHNANTGQAWNIAAGAVAVVTVAAALVLIVIDNLQYSRGEEYIADGDLVMGAWYVLFATALTAIAAGFILMRRGPMVGAALAVGGSLTAGILVFWLIIPPFAGVAIAWYAVHRARRLAAAAVDPR